MAKKFSLVLVCVAFLFLVFMGMPSGGFAQGAKDYVGSAACKDCHEKAYGDFQKNVHNKKMVAGSPAAEKGCESCHGPGGEHVAKGGGKGTIASFGKETSTTKKSASCLGCHEGSKKLAFWSMGKHMRQDVSCSDCHSVHLAKAKHSLATKEPDVCYSCHQDIKAQNLKQSHHPLKEGKVKCTDCHTAHGSLGEKALVKDTVNDTCYQCHTEKRGPFAYEHAPVEEDCGICHTAHGSNHNKLLVRKAPQLCQSCHSPGSGHYSRPYNLPDTFGGVGTRQNRIVSKGCLNCHGNIHGSMNSPAFER